MREKKSCMNKIRPEHTAEWQLEDWKSNKPELYKKLCEDGLEIDNLPPIGTNSINIPPIKLNTKPSL